MIFEGVNFNEEAIKGLSREEFERLHGALWNDRDVRTRKRMLRQVYGMIMPEPEEEKE